jgi:uncharacterized repeat protein (TIGR01451 family)
MIRDRSGGGISLPLKNTRRGRHLPAQRSMAHRNTALTMVFALLLGFMSIAAPTLTATPAHAAPGDPFNPATATVYIAQAPGTPGTTLYRSVTDGTGTTTFVAEGAEANLIYNAVAYNTTDNYIYAMANSNGTASNGTAIPFNSLIRIGQGGYITRVGAATYTTGAPTVLFNVGTIGADGNYYAMTSDSTVMRVINPTTGALVNTINLTSVPNAADLTYSDGFLWGINTGGGVVRINPATGAVVAYPAIVPAATAYGGSWLYGNGNLGFSNNDTGTVYQIKVTNPSAATPSFAVVASNPGPPSGSNDGTSSPGLPADLGIVKTGPAWFSPSGTLTYDITVTNNGPGVSSGFVVSDSVPAPLTNVASTSAGCDIVANDVTCVSGTLAVGASQSFTITAQAPANATAPVTNTATVLGNEEDSNPGNNTSSVTSTPSLPGITFTKTADKTGDLVLGENLTYTFTAENTGNTPLTGVAISEGAFSGTGTLSPLNYAWPGTPGTLLAGETVTATATYVVTQADVDAGSIANTADVTGTPPTGPPVTGTDTFVVPSSDPAPALTVTKTADDSALQSPAKAGDVITYNFTAENTGNVTLTDVVIEDQLAGLSALTYTWSGAAGTLAPGEKVTATATYAITQADIDAGQIVNSATGTGTPPNGPPIVTPPSEVTTTIDPVPGQSFTKTADASAVTDPAKAGQVITYHFTSQNTGNVTLTNVAITDELAGLSPLVYTWPGTAGTLLPGQTVTATATYAITQADIDAGKVSNTALATGTDPSGGTTTPPPGTAVVVVPPTPAATPPPAPVPAVPADPPAPLANTGALAYTGASQFGLPLGLGLLLLVGGAGFLIFGKKKRLHH